MKKANNVTEVILIVLCLVATMVLWLYFTTPQIDLSGSLLRIACSLGVWLGVTLGVEESRHGTI